MASPTSTAASSPPVHATDGEREKQPTPIMTAEDLIEAQRVVHVGAAGPREAGRPEEVVGEGEGEPHRAD